MGGTSIREDGLGVIFIVGVSMRINHNIINVMLICCECGQAVRRHATHRRDNGTEEHSQ
jgi:hypothetical protein